MIVRKLQPYEFDATMNLFNYYRDEAIEAVPAIGEEYDENSMINTVRHYSSAWDHIWLNAYVNTRPVGFVAGFLSPLPWNKNIIEASISFIFLHESYRNMDSFRELLNAFEEWARICKAKNIIAGDVGINPERTQKLYEHFDFKPGVWMSKEIKYV